MNTGEYNPLTKQQIDQVVSVAKQKTAQNAYTRILINGQAMNVQTGEVASRGSNVIYHPCIWDLNREAAKMMLQFVKDNNPGHKVTMDYQPSPTETARTASLSSLSESHKQQKEIFEIKKEPDSKKFEECLKGYLEAAYERGWEHALDVDEPLTEDEAWEICQDWSQWDWWAYSVLPDFRKQACECLFEALGIEDPSEAGVSEEEIIDIEEAWRKAELIIEERFPEWIGESMDDLIEQMYAGWMNGLRENKMLIEE